MGGHGGLNILPQKRWNVYNYENREKVRRDEEAAAREEQLKRDQSRRRDAEFRLERLRQARGLAAATSSAAAAAAAATSSAAAAAAAVEEAEPPSDSRHINLFDGVPDFASLAGQDEGKRPLRGEEGGDGSSRNPKRRRKEEPPKVVAPEDEKYRLGYGVAGKGVKAPWYLTKPSASAEDALDEGAKGSGSSNGGAGSKKRSGGGGKKSIEELREERMKREKQEKGRERALLASMGKQRGDRRLSRRAT